MPDVTVVIPTLNRHELLAAHALPSALGQEDVSFDIVVVDDGSTTPVAEVPGVRVIRHERSRGIAAARNAGILAAEGEWVAFLDDDDLWAPRYLNAVLDTAGDAGWAYAGAVVIDDTYTVIGELEVPDPAGVGDALRHGNVIGGGSRVVVRSDLLRRMGGFDESLYYVEDWDLLLRIAEAAPAAALNEALVATLDHPHRALFRDPDAVARGIEVLLARNGGTAADMQGAAEWLAREHAHVGRYVDAARLYARAALRFRSPGNAASAVAALFGRPGLRAAAKLLRAPHLVSERVVLPPPDWLAERSQGSAG
jgi:glycosyltransferase involved in cell wall biosynthesis